MRYLIVNLFIIFNTIAFGQGLEEQLSAVFKSGSERKLIEFLDKWNASYTPIDNKGLEDMGTTKKEIYSLYSVFYNPLKIEQYCFNEDGYNPFYRNMEQIKAKNSKGYIVVQNQIEYVVLQDSILTPKEIDYRTNANKAYEIKDTIRGFRPDLDFLNAKVLYLSGDYKICFESFFRVSNESVSKQDSKRYDILNKQLSPYWDLSKKNAIKLVIETTPRVSEIYFNKGRTQAIIYYDLGFLEGEANYFKKEGLWIKDYIRYTKTKN